MEKAFNSLSGQMGSNAFMLGSLMSIADPYLYWTLLAALRFNIALPEKLRTFFDRMNQEPSVIRALAEEGLSTAADASR